MTLVHNSGEPVRDSSDRPMGRVLVHFQLLDAITKQSVAAFLTTGEAVAQDNIFLQTDANGIFQASLTPNSLINPATCYGVKIGIDPVQYIQVPDTDSVTLSSLLALSSSPPTETLNPFTEHLMDNTIHAKSRSLAFVNQTEIPVVHGLGRKPSVWVLDTNGYEIEGVIKHLNDNRFDVTLTPATSGTICYL